MMNINVYTGVIICIYIAEAFTYFGTRSIGGAIPRCSFIYRKTDMYSLVLSLTSVS